MEKSDMTRRGFLRQAGAAAASWAAFSRLGLGHARHTTQSRGLFRHLLAAE